MLNIYLTRHGQDVDNSKGILNGQRDDDISKKGIEQVEALAGKLIELKLNFDQIYSSPLKRSVRTAEIIAEKLEEKNIEILPDLIERNFGIMTGKKISEIATLCYPEILEVGDVKYFLAAQGAETFPELILRAKKVLNIVESKLQSGNVLLVSHGDFGKMIYAAYYRIDWQKALQSFHFGNTDLILLAPDSSADKSIIYQADQYNL